MRVLGRCLLLTACFGGTTTTPASAQVAAAQAWALRGLEEVCVVPYSLTRDVDAHSFWAMVDYAVWDLDRGGLQWVECPALIEGLGDRALIKVGLGIDSPGPGSPTFFIRIHVEQDVLVARTGERLQLVTWFYEAEEQVSGDGEDQIMRALRRGFDSLLTDWLDANRR